MKVLVLNTGSSSIKFRVFEADGNGEARDLAQGLLERIGLSAPKIKCACCLGDRDDCAAKKLTHSPSTEIPDHTAGINIICNILRSDHCGILSDLSEIVGIGHRVVHGGEEFSGSMIIDDAVLEGIEKCSRLAPLHNPPALQGIRACTQVFGSTPQVAVFDTAFFHTLPPRAYYFPLSRELYDKYSLRKYGFHGTSHRYVSEQALRLLDKPAADTRIITCHLGNGCSVSAVKGGQAVETSMGLTPLGGVMMGTRPGDLDPYLPLFMIKELGMSVDEVDRALNKESGLKGVCGLTDMRDIEARAAEGDANCQQALEMFAYRIARFIGSYTMVLGGVDAIVFTAGIGERDAAMRKRILENAAYLGIKVDDARNEKHATIISTDDSTGKAMVIPTNEELVIARDTARLVREFAGNTAEV